MSVQDLVETIIAAGHMNSIQQKQLNQLLMTSQISLNDLKVMDQLEQALITGKIQWDHYAF